MSRQALLVLSLMLGLVLGAGEAGFSSKAETFDGADSIHAGLDDPAPAPSSPICPKKTAPLPLAVLDQAPKPAEVAVFIQPLEERLAPRLVDLGPRLGRAPPA